jgi:anti-sigma28 factor (negative regulator of flagellin synthesis)
MIIKNSDYNFNYISNSHLGTVKKAEKADAVPSGANAGSTFAGELSKLSNSPKVDTIELSKQPVKSHTTLPAVRDRILSELREDNDPAFVEQLKAQINSNQYEINPHEIAKILLLNNNE